MMGWAAPAAAQRSGRLVQGGETGAIRVSGFAAGSWRGGPGGLRLAEDVLSVSGRFTLARFGFQPWIQGEYFTRPDLQCLPGVPCNDDGWTVLAGVVAPLSVRDTQPGLHLYLLGGIGWAFSAENRFTYLMGLGGAYAVTRRIAPSMEVRWEDPPGIKNVVMVNLGLRLDLF